MLAHPGWSGAHWIAKSSATSIPSPAAARDKAAEIGERAELGIDRPVTALFRADRIGAARIARLGDRAVVFALAVDPADRMDRHEIDDIEAEPRRFRAAARYNRQRWRSCPALGPGCAGTSRTRRQTRLRAVDDDLQLAPIAHPVARDRRPAPSARAIRPTAAARRGRAASAAAKSSQHLRAAAPHPPPRHARSAASTRCPPSTSSSAMSWPASRFFSTSSRQLSKRSVQASIV